MNLIVAIVIAVCVYLWQKKLYASWWNKNLDVTISFADTCIREGDESTLTETIYNGKLLPLPVFHVKFSTARALEFADRENASVTDGYYRNDIFSVLGYRKIMRRLLFCAKKRGLYGILTLHITARDFFMTTNFASSKKCDTWLYVLPSRIRVPAFDIYCRKLVGEVWTRQNLIEDPYEFRGIREYTYGDTMRRINWKKTAHVSSLMVNQYGYTSEQRIKILLNLETNIMVKTDYMQELCIRMAGTAADVFLHEHISVDLASNGVDVLTGQCECVEAGMSLAHGETIDKYLARISENAGIDRFLSILDTVLLHREQNVMYLIISPYYKEDLLRKLDYMQQMGASVHMIVPYYDIQDTENWRPYMQGMEVKWNET